MNRLRNLRLEFNDLTGTIPTEVGNMTQLEDFTVHSNRLNGTIPIMVKQIEYLETFNIRNNSFTGTIPTTFTRNSRIAFLDLALNDLTGTIPSFLIDCNRTTSVRYLDTMVLDCGDFVESIGSTVNASRICRESKCCWCSENFKFFDAIGF